MYITLLKMETNTIPTTTELSEGLIEAYETFGYVNRELSQTEVIKMCDQHGIFWARNPERTALYIGEEQHAPDTEATNWTLFDFLAFLNY